jgi:hypothetical protein
MEIIKTSTGNHNDDKDFREIIYPFGKYEIKVMVDQYGIFLGISQIKVNKDFRNIEQKISSTGYIDIEDLYKEEK